MMDAEDVEVSDGTELCETGTTNGKEELGEADSGELDSGTTGTAELEVEDPEPEETGITTRELPAVNAGDESDVVEGI